MSTGYQRMTVGTRHWLIRRILTLSLLASGCGALLSGCMLFEQPVDRGAPNALGWLTNWNSQPLASTKPFDLEVIKPDEKRARLVPESWLEITVWDLYEPGKPHTFPVRVTARKTIDVPLVGEHSVAGQGPAEVESTLADEFRQRDLLKAPRILVRSLDSGHVRVQVTGAVLRPGFVELARNQASVYDAVVAAGGLKSIAGSQISVTSRSAASPTVALAAAPTLIIRGQSPETGLNLFAPGKRTRQSSGTENKLNGPRITPGTGSTATLSETNLANDQVLTALLENAETSGEQVNSTASHNLHANRIEELSVPLPPRTSAAALQQPAKERVPAAPPVEVPEDAVRINNRKSPASGGNGVRWFDISLESDRQTLQSLILNEGDCVLVKSAAPPIRIAGSVNRPGDYALPMDRSVDLWQALELGGGIKTSGTPLYITLLRPPGEGHGPQRWQWQFDSVETRPRDVPKVLPGDVIDIQPPASSKLRKAVGGLWNN